MFWTRGADSIQEFLELRQENRCQDEWLSLFLKRARHGDMEHELYCFMHGLPTKHAGSWMPNTNEVRCGQKSCQALSNQWFAECKSSTPRKWSERQEEECQICAKERRLRCRVLHNIDHSNVLDAKFADAPLIHPWNAPKYHASLVRARLYAKRTQQVLLWCVAEDTPWTTEHRNLLPEELDTKLSLIHI